MKITNALSVLENMEEGEARYEYWCLGEHLCWEDGCSEWEGAGECKLNFVRNKPDRSKMCEDGAITEWNRGHPAEEPNARDGDGLPIIQRVVGGSPAEEPEKWETCEHDVVETECLYCNPGIRDEKEGEALPSLCNIVFFGVIRQAEDVGDEPAYMVRCADCDEPVPFFFFDSEEEWQEHRKAVGCKPRIYCPEHDTFTEPPTEEPEGHPDHVCSPLCAHDDWPEKEGA
jgi:hypothetical protein